MMVRVQLAESLMIFCAYFERLPTINVFPPGKLARKGHLSGGEKALSANSEKAIEVIVGVNGFWSMLAAR